MMTDDDIISVVQAHKEGKAIQMGGGGAWSNVHNPQWNFREYDYRVAPEPRKPREWFIWPNVPLIIPGTEANRSQLNGIWVREVIE